MRRPLLRRLAERDGSVAVEFALTGSAFFLLVFFILEAGLLLWTKSAMQMAAAQTARCTAIGSSECQDAKAYAMSLIATWGVGGIVSSPSVEVQPGTTCNNTAGHYSAVTITAAAAGLGVLIAPLSSAALSVTACYPSGP